MHSRTRARARAHTHTQDVSRLVDVCRQAIVFDDIADVTACVTLISNDSDVRILRVKNRFTGSASVSGGYRDVLLNLCVVTDAARALGVERHVCEVQLILRSFFLLKVWFLYPLAPPYSPALFPLLLSFSARLYFFFLAITKPLRSEQFLSY